MTTKSTQAFVSAVASGNKNAANAAFASALKERLSSAVEVRKVAVTETIYGKRSEKKS